MAKSSLTIRLYDELRARLDVALAATPYPPTVTTVIERGLVLAIAEMEKMAAAIKAGD